MKENREERLYELITDNMVGELTLAQAFNAELRAQVILQKTINGDLMTEEDEEFFPEPLDIPSFEAIGILPGEIALSALAISYGDNLLDILYDQQDVKAIFQRLNRKVKNTHQESFDDSNGGLKEPSSAIDQVYEV